MGQLLYVELPLFFCTIPCPLPMLTQWDVTYCIIIT